MRPWVLRCIALVVQAVIAGVMKYNGYGAVASGFSLGALFVWSLWFLSEIMEEHREAKARAAAAERKDAQWRAETGK